MIVVDADDLRDAAKALRRHANGKVLSRKMTGAIRAEVRPAVRAVKAAYGGGRHLRPALRRATRMQVKTGGAGAGVRVMVDGTRMPPGMGSLPAYREAVRAPWRHPVYGNRNNWVTQRPVPVFFQTVEPFADPVFRGIQRAATEVTEEIAHG